MKNQCKQEFAGSDDEPAEDVELSFVNSRPILPLDTVIGDFPPVKRPLHTDKLLQVFEVAEHGSRASVIVLARSGHPEQSILAQQKWFDLNTKFAATKIKQIETQVDGINYVASYCDLLGQVALNTPGKLRHVNDAWLLSSVERTLEFQKEAQDLGLVAALSPAVITAKPLFAEFYLAPFALIDDSWKKDNSELIKQLCGNHTYIKLLYWLIGGINLFDDCDETPSLLSQWAPELGIRNAEFLRASLERDDDFSLQNLFAELKKSSSKSSSTTASADDTSKSPSVRTPVSGGLSRIVGKLEIKQVLARELVAGTRDTDSSTLGSNNLNACTSVMFVGPSGCGKTFLAKALADELAVLLIQIRPSDIASMYVRESVLR
ncbi:MAG: ATP-binding protein, partial [Candidatus Obscuribacterales bacterium]|nr:ATP-binding protein [Candidatus Obscuribacterales bacterium]